jgi:hypothetical protein
VGEAARRHRQAGSQGHRPQPRPQTAPAATREDPRSRAQAAITRLVRGNPPGRVSLAGAYALGYAAIGLAQQEGEEPTWYPDLDPLDALVLGTVWPRQMRDGYEFGNARTAWLAALRGTAHWAGIERFARVVITASEEHGLPVDDGELMLLVAGRLEAAGLDHRKLPRQLLPGTLLAGSRVDLGGPPAGQVLPEPPPDAAEQAARLWAGTQVHLKHDGTAADALREGLGMLARAGIDVRAEVVTMLPALYAALAAAGDEDLAEAGERAVAWAVGLPEDSPLIPRPVS